MAWRYVRGTVKGLQSSTVDGDWIFVKDDKNDYEWWKCGVQGSMLTVASNAKQSGQLVVLIYDDLDVQKKIQFLYLFGP